MKQNAALKDYVLTRGKMEPIIKDLKEFITTTVKGTENVLRAEINGVKDGLNGVKGELRGVKEELAGVKITVDGHSNAIMDLARELKETRTHLSDKIDRVEKKLDSHIHPGKSHLKLV